MTGQQSVSRLFTLDGQVAVVTGAAAGIGKATARLLADAGATVVVADKDADGAAEVAKTLGADAAALAFDLTDEPSITALFEAVQQRFGRLDVLVNNAGIYPRYPLEMVTCEQWEEMQKVNVWGCFAVLRAAARVMRDAGRGGRVINVSSIGARRTAVLDQVAYNASKAALDSVTLSAALELAADGILVNSILPGMVRPLDPKPRDPAHTAPDGPLIQPGRVLLGRPASAMEVAGPILMLASAAGAYITGQLIVVDGGFSLS